MQRLLRARQRPRIEEGVERDVLRLQRLDEFGKRSQDLAAQVEATNSSSITTYTYEFGVTFKDSSGADLRTSTSTIPYSADPAVSGSATMSASTVLVRSWDIQAGSAAAIVRRQVAGAVPNAFLKAREKAASDS